MKACTERDLLVMEDGTTFYANRCIVGLSPGLGISEGYDGGWMEKEWSQAHRIELADYMLAKWQEYRERAVAGLPESED